MAQKGIAFISVARGRATRFGAPVRAGVVPVVGRGRQLLIARIW
jgi:hypothetical protein